MNTVRILICVTFALLVGALVHSYTTNGSSSSSSKASQASSLSDNKTISQLRQEYESARLENKRKRDIYINQPLTYSQPLTYNTPQTTYPTQSSVPSDAFVNPLASSDVSLTVAPAPDLVNEELEEKLSMLAEENERLKQQQMLLDSENEMMKQEAQIIQEEILSAPPIDTARAKAIAGAMTMARVQVYDPESGILLLDVARPQNISAGQILGIRRGDAGGIIGRITLSSIEGHVGYADPIPTSFFGEVDIQAGDEIIVIP